MITFDQKLEKKRRKEDTKTKTKTKTKNVPRVASSVAPTPSFCEAKGAEREVNL
jgi:hypothetical protein